VGIVDIIIERHVICNQRVVLHCTLRMTNEMMVPIISQNYWFSDEFGQLSIQTSQHSGSICWRKTAWPGINYIWIYSLLTQDFDGGIIWPHMHCGH